MLNPNIKVTRVSNAVAAGATDVNCSEIDMEGYDGVMFVAALGTLTAGQATSMHAQGTSTSGSGYSDLEGTSLGNMDDADDNKLLILDIRKPEKRYIRAVLDRATANAVVDGVIAIQYGAKKAPTTHDSSVALSESHATPAEGTA